MGSEVVFITGASAGVGRAIAREFARHGARIGLFARGLEGLVAARQEVERLGGEAFVLSGDVADAARVEEAASEVEARFGPLDVWVNNAMVSVFSPVERMTSEEYRRVTEVTYLGVVHGTLSALSRMKPRDRGCIVQVGSALSYRAIPLQSAYCAAKHAVEGFTESLRTELLHEGSRVSVTMVQLPALNTPQFDWARSRLARKAKPVPPIFQPEVAARAVYWASHQRRREVYVGWPTVKAIVGGSRIAPGFGDRFLARRGYDSQQANEPEDPRRPDNLYAPVPGDRGARGRFDSEAREKSVQLWMAMHRFGIGMTVAGLGVLALMLSGFASRGPDWRSGERPPGSRRSRTSLGP